MYLSNRFFWALGAVAALFAVSYPFAMLYPLAQTSLVGFVGLLLTDVLLLFARKPEIRCNRELNPVFSLSDPNNVRINLENQSGFYLNFKVADEFPVQFQIRDEEVNVGLPPRQRLLH